MASHSWDQSALVVARADPWVEAYQLRDRLKIIGYFAGRAGQRLDLAQAVTATRLPVPRALKTIDALVDDGYLIWKGMRQSRAGWSPTWARLDPTEEDPI